MANTITAYSVYHYDAQGVGTGMAGRIGDTGGSVTPVPGLDQNLNGDPKVEGFTNSSNVLCIAVTDYETETPQPVTVYDATSAVPLGTQTWSNVDNLYSLVTVGNALYAIDYDNARVVEINPATYAQTPVSYTLDGAYVPSGHVAHGQALININDVLYGLFTFVTPDWTSYANSLLVRFTLVPGTSISIAAPTDTNNALAKNAFSLAVSGNDLYIAAIGGQQGSSGTPNAASRVQKLPYAAADLSGAPITDVMSPNPTFPYEFRDISFNGATAYILMGTYNAAWQLAGKLVSTTDFMTFTMIDDFGGGASGYFWSAQYTADNNRIWFARGNQILVYDAANTAAPVATLTLTAGSLISAGELYDNLNDLAYVGALGTRVGMRGYRSPVQASRTTRAAKARAMVAGRPELSKEEQRQLDADPALV